MLYDNNSERVVTARLKNEALVGGTGIKIGNSQKVGTGWEVVAYGHKAP